MQQNPGCLRKTLISSLVIIIGILLCSVVSVAGIDVLCRNDIDTNLPLYPQGVVVSEESGFFRSRAMGRSEIVMTSGDTVQEVRAWYGDYRDGMKTQSSYKKGLANVNFSIDEDPETGQTLIYLLSECAYNS